MSVPIETLPTAARMACERLRDELQETLGEDLIALWAYGAMTFEDRPKLGDVDTHGVLARPPEPEMARTIDQIHESIANDLGVVWDSWYILKTDATTARHPCHAFREHLVDQAWGLHRAHWLAGQYVAISGSVPGDIIAPPRWQELMEALHNELVFVEKLVEEGGDILADAAYAVWNSCRIIYSLETRDVVVSKLAAARWALDHLPSDWHAAIRAAGRVYDGTEQSGDRSLLKSSMAPIMGLARDRIDYHETNR